jgi:ketosteroid isomerase-like protein
MTFEAIEVVEAFVAAINRQDVAAMAELMAEDHTFIDSGGTVESGREKMIPGWEGYFRMFPDYEVRVENIIADGNLVAAFGSACGTYNGKRGLVQENRIEMPAAWKAIIEDGKVKFWQVYADWSEGGKIIEEDEKAG